jgi:hypothetical protein
MQKFIKAFIRRPPHRAQRKAHSMQMRILRKLTTDDISASPKEQNFGARPGQPGKFTLFTILRYVGGAYHMHGSTAASGTSLPLWYPSDRVPC